MRFHEEEVRPMGRSAAGVRGIKVAHSDEVVAACLAEEGKSLLVVTEKGYGKRTDFNSFNPKHRAGQGVIGISLSPEKGRGVASRSVGEEDEVFMIASNGVIIRMKVNSISIQGRAATGGKLMSVENDSTVTAIAPVIQQEDVIESEN